MAKNHIPQDLQVWIDARKKFHLSDAHIQMARELGMNPKKFGGLANHRQERWKMPLPQFIEYLFLKSFGKRRPDRVVSIENRAKEIAQKKGEKRERKLAARSASTQS
ncbi:MAG: hypothetical protein ACREBG_16090 [Pyrinomonadaceae bacterium]